MSARCSTCGDAHLVAVRIPGHDDIEAIICLTCSATQVDERETAGRSGAPHRPLSGPPAGP